jgi:hypothetical protein
MLHLVRVAAVKMLVIGERDASAFPRDQLILLVALYLSIKDLVFMHSRREVKRRSRNKGLQLERTAVNVNADLSLVIVHGFASPKSGNP